MERREAELAGVWPLQRALAQQKRRDPRRERVLGGEPLGLLAGEWDAVLAQFRLPQEVVDQFEVDAGAAGDCYS